MPRGDHLPVVQASLVLPSWRPTCNMFTTELLTLDENLELKKGVISSRHPDCYSCWVCLQKLAPEALPKSRRFWDLSDALFFACANLQPWTTRNHCGTFIRPFPLPTIEACTFRDLCESAACWWHALEAPWSWPPLFLQCV